VIATDPEGRIRYWNRFAERLYGWPAEEVLGRNIVDVTPSSASKEQATKLLERLMSGESWSGEFLVQRRAANGHGGGSRDPGRGPSQLGAP
jgi:PAS domain S-box-containing protein